MGAHCVQGLTVCRGSLCAGASGSAAARVCSVRVCAVCACSLPHVLVHRRRRAAHCPVRGLEAASLLPFHAHLTRIFPPREKSMRAQQAEGADTTCMAFAVWVHICHRQAQQAEGANTTRMATGAVCMHARRRRAQ